MNDIDAGMEGHAAAVMDYAGRCLGLVNEAAEVSDNDG